MRKTLHRRLSSRYATAEDVGTPVDTLSTRARRLHWMSTAAAAVATAVSVLTVLVATRAADDPVAFVERRLPAWLIALELVAVVLMVAGVWALCAHHPQASIGLAGATIASLMPLWGAWSWLPGILRAAMLSATPFVIAGLAETVFGWFSDGPSIPRLGPRVALVFVGVAALIHLLGYNPFLDPGCARTCEDVEPVLEGLVSTRLTVAITSSLSIVAASVIAVAILTTRNPRTPRPVVGLVLVALGGHAASSAVLWVAWGETATSSVLLFLEPAAVGVIGAAICVVAGRTFRVRAAVERMVGGLSGAETSLSGLGGGILAVHFAVQGAERWVDAVGHDVADPPEGNKGIVLFHDSSPVLRLVLARGADEADVLAGLSPGSRLALQNAQLSAVAKARLYDVQASQRRVVAAFDAERQRIERDLHDGAQQRLVGAALHLKVALAGADPSSAALLERAEHRLHDALARLRHLAHGMFPNVLAEEGLRAALEELVAESDVPARLDISLRDPVGVEPATASYYAVVAALGRVERPTAGTHAWISVVQGSDSITVRTEVRAGGAPVVRSEFIDVADRVGAVGGRLTLSEADDRGVVVIAVIPCAS